MSSLSPAALNGRSRSSPAPTLGDRVEHPASNGAPASDRTGGTQFSSNAVAGGSRRAGAALKQQQREELGRIVASTAEVGELLGDLGSDDVDRALEVVFAARSELDRSERQLVRLALQAGRSWARIGDALGIHTGRAAQARFGNTQ
jgi:hypothetical protein